MARDFLRKLTSCVAGPQPSVAIDGTFTNDGGAIMGKSDYHSVRINDQWRIVFRWTDAGPEDVEIIDYH